MKVTEGKFENLPKWAQREISRLKRDCQYWKGKAEVGPEGSDTFADAYMERGKPLGNGPRITFVLGEGWMERVDVRKDGNAIEIHSPRGINIRPSASNTCYVELSER